MQHFRTILFYLLAGSAAAAQIPLPQTLQAAQPVQPVNLTDHGTLRILTNSQLMGTERFDIEPAGSGYRLKGDLRVKLPNGTDINESAVLNVDSDLHVLSYTRLQKSPKKASVQVDFAAGIAKAHYVIPNDGAKDYQYMLESGMVILDTNFFHHFALLVGRYDFNKGGAQHMQVFIPQQASPGMMLVEYKGKDANTGLDELVAKTDAVEIHIWCDAGRKLQRLAVPAAKVEIVRDTKN